MTIINNEIIVNVYRMCLKILKRKKMKIMN